MTLSRKNDHLGFVGTLSEIRVETFTNFGMTLDTRLQEGT